MNPQLTSSQRQELHSSVVEHRTGNREVTGSNPVEVLNFFQASLRSYIIAFITAMIISSFNLLNVMDHAKVADDCITDREKKLTHILRQCAGLVNVIK